MDQTKEVYRSEDLLCQIIDQQHVHPQLLIGNSMVLVPNDRKFQTVANIQSYVNKVTDQQGVKAVTVVPKLHRGKGRQLWAHYDPSAGEIHIPMRAKGKWAQREVVVLHELAHHLTWREPVGHGPKFAGKLLELIEEYIGLEAHFILRILYADNGVVVA